MNGATTVMSDPAENRPYYRLLGIRSEETAGKGESRLLLDKP